MKNLIHRFLHRGKAFTDGEEEVGLHMQTLKNLLTTAEQQGAYSAMSEGLGWEWKYDRLKREAGCQHPLEPWDYNAAGIQLQSGDVIQNKMIVGEEWVGLASWAGMTGYLEDVLIKNCLLLGSRIWASNSHYHRKNFRMENVSIVSVRNEHALYHRPYGYGQDATEEDLHMPSSTYNRIHFYGVGSQAMQLRGPSDLESEYIRDFYEEDTPGGLLSLTDSVVELSGHPRWGARPAHTLSFRTSKNPLLVRDVLHDGTKQEECTGTLLVEGDVGQPNWQGYQRKVDVRRLTSVLTKTDRPAAQFDGCGDVLLEECHFEVGDGQPWLEANGCRSLTLKNNSGNVRVKWNKNQPDASTTPIEQDQVFGVPES